MDNRINENRKKIRLLRVQMLEAEAAIRGQIGRDRGLHRNFACPDGDAGGNVRAFKGEGEAWRRQGAYPGRADDAPAARAGGEADLGFEAAPCTQTKNLKLS